MPFCGNIIVLISVFAQRAFVNGVAFFGASRRDHARHIFVHTSSRALKTLIDERGEDYLCGENGKDLSGGEKQRISIARSLLKRSRILIADEATSALDNKTSHDVIDEILDLKDMTRIVVTHSLDEDLLSRYDEILVLKDGRIEEKGDFRTLMDNNGYFKALFTVA